MPEICREIDEWIEEEVTRPVEEWVERTERRCRNWPWPLNWICKVVTVLVKVVTYVVEIVGRWVTRTVCTYIHSFIVLLGNIISGIIDIVIGIFTLDWARILDGFGTIIGGIVGHLLTVLRVLTLGDTIDFIIELAKNYQLRTYVGELLENKYSGRTLDEIKDALSVDYGSFGFRIRMEAVRTYVDSEFKSDPNLPPDLWRLHNNGDIDLWKLCGFEFDEFWNRSRHIAIRKGPVISGGGGFNNQADAFTISRRDLEQYIDNEGQVKIHFLMYSMSDSSLNTKLTTAEEVGRDLGLKTTWKKTAQEIVELSHIIQPGNNQTSNPNNQPQILIDVHGRASKSNDLDQAISDLCTPLAAGVFGYERTVRSDGSIRVLNGLGSNLMESDCISCVDCGSNPGLSGKDASGVTFRDRKPDFVWKYLLIHELGHYFGLCHVDNGIDRIMFSPAGSGWASWRMISEYLYFKGRASFILGEAKQTWDYIVENFDSDCLRERHE